MMSPVPLCFTLQEKHSGSRLRVMDSIVYCKNAYLFSEMQIMAVQLWDPVFLLNDAEISKTTQKLAEE